MRLTCPNCSARYEVDDSMVPPEGRDVQCSSCATTWFQPGRRTDVQPSAVHVARPAAPSDDPADGPDDMADQQPQADQAPGDPPQAPVRPVRPRRPIAPEVRNVLREEAEREARLRQGEANPVETQTEMTLAEAPDADNRVQRRADLENAQDAFAAEEAAEAVGSRRDLLPDIEEINSTLRASGDRSAGEETTSDIDTLDTAPRRRSGMRTGFLLVLIVAGVGAGVYANADRIADAVPQVSGALDGFVSSVNAARFWLDDTVRSLAGDSAG